MVLPQQQQKSIGKTCVATNLKAEWRLILSRFSEVHAPCFNIISYQTRGFQKINSITPPKWYYEHGSSISLVVFHQPIWKILRSQNWIISPSRVGILSNSSLLMAILPWPEFSPLTKKVTLSPPKQAQLSHHFVDGRELAWKNQGWFTRDSQGRWDALCRKLPILLGCPAGT